MNITLSKPELEHKKQELITLLQDKTFQLSLVLKLLMGTDVDDKDFKQVLTDGVGDQIIKLLVSDFTKEELQRFLEKYKCNLFKDYSNSDIVYLNEYTDFDELIDNNEDLFDVDDEGNYQFSGQMMNEDTGTYVRSW